MDPQGPLIPKNRYFSPLKDQYGRSYCQRKSIINKYYGRKIIFVGRKNHFTAAMNRCKYLFRFKIYDNEIPASSLQSLANLIIFNIDIIIQGHYGKNISTSTWSFLLPNIHPFKLKRALRSCKDPKPESPQLQHLQNLFHLKSLTLHVQDGYSMDEASKTIRNLRLVEELHVKYIHDYSQDDPILPIKIKPKMTISNPNDKKGWGFFYKISKLPRLQRFSLQTSLKTLEGQSYVVQQDFADFYSGSHRFKIETEVYTNSSLDLKELTAKNMASIFKKADSLSLQMGVTKPKTKNLYKCEDFQSAELSEEENKKIIKQGERPVKFFVLYKEKSQVNIGCLLTQCENLVSLYLKVSGIEVLWDQDYGNLSTKLQTVILDLDSLGLKYEILEKRRPPSRFQIEDEIHYINNNDMDYYIDDNQRKVKFHSGLVELLKQLKRSDSKLETFIVLICSKNFKKSWLQPKSFPELYEEMVERKAKEFFEELACFEWIDKLQLYKKTGDPTETTKSLKTVSVYDFWDD